MIRNAPTKNYYDEVLKLVPQASASGQKATFDDGGKDCPVTALNVEINPSQYLNGFDAPWVGGSRKNQFRTTMNSGSSWGGMRYVVDSVGRVIFNGKDTLADINMQVGTVSLTAGTNYTASGLPYNNIALELRLGSSTLVTQIAPSGTTFTAPATGDYTMWVVISRGTQLTNYQIKPMVCLASATDPTVYEPWANICPISGRSSATIYVSPTSTGTGAVQYSVPFGQTVYGGSLDAVKGELTITHKKISLGDYSYGKSGNNFYISSVTDFKYADTSGYFHYGNGLSNAFKFGTDNWNAEDSTCTCYYHSGYSGYRIFFRLDSHANDTEAEFKTFMQSIGAEFCYELASPTTVSLTANEIRTLYGTNYIWANTLGDTSVTYRANATLLYNKIRNAILAQGGQI